MDLVKDILKKRKGGPNHPNNLLAEDLAAGLRDRNNFGYYLSVAKIYPHLYLRQVMAEAKERKNPPAWFRWRLKNDWRWGEAENK